MKEKPRPSPTSDVEGAATKKVTEGLEGMRRLEDLLRRILKVPKDSATNARRARQ